MAVDSSASISTTAAIGEGVVVWGLAHVGAGAEIGRHSILGRGVVIGAEVRIGEFCKLQSYAQVYGPAIVEDYCFIGPGAVFTNDLNPRATDPSGNFKSIDDWETKSTIMKLGASVGANVVCVAPIQIGSWAMIGAGAVVTRDVPDHALIVGNPGRQVGWVGKSGIRLEQIAEQTFVCPTTRERYLVVNNCLVSQDS